MDQNGYCHLHFTRLSMLTSLQAAQGRRFGAAALRCVARVAKAAPDWGVIFFGYDWFAAYSAAAAANVAWDILIPHYKAPLPSRICSIIDHEGQPVNDVAVLAQAHGRNMQTANAAARHSFLPDDSELRSKGVQLMSCASTANMARRTATTTTACGRRATRCMPGVQAVHLSRPALDAGYAQSFQLCLLQRGRRTATTTTACARRATRCTAATRAACTTWPWSCPGCPRARATRATPRWPRWCGRLPSSSTGAVENHRSSVGLLRCECAQQHGCQHHAMRKPLTLQQESH